MKHEKIVEVARSITNGDRIVLKYERPVKVLKRQTSREFTKLSIVEFVFNERDWFTLSREVNGLNIQGDADREPLYTKISGCLWEKISDGKPYFRCAVPASKISTTVLAFEGSTEVSLYPKGHKNSKGKESIYDLLQAGEKPDYTCNDKQTSLHTSTGMVEDKIVQLQYLIERIYSLEVE